MILKTLRINNIRSYENYTIDFRKGITFFEGDIGSGKSSILSAIEFALFGLGNQSGSHLLRLGENEGNVELEIEINQKDIKFGRSLKRKGKRVIQDICFIQEEGVQTKYNPTNMKKRTLQILGFKEPTNPRSHSLIYRYAIFTPQEQMREVIRQRPDERKQTLRKAFGVEEYSIAANNASSILSTIRKEINSLENSQIEVEILRERIQTEEDSKKIAFDIIEKSSKELKIIKTKLEDLTIEISQKKDEKIQKTHLETKHSLIYQEKSQIEKRISENIKLLEATEKNLKEAHEQKSRANELRPLYIELNELRKINSELEPENKSYNDSLHQMELVQNKIDMERKILEEKYLDTETNWIEIGKRIEDLDEKLEKLPLLKIQEKKLDEQIKKDFSLQESNIDNQRKQEGLQQSISILQIQKKEKQLEWKNIESIGVGALCPRCHQELTEEHLNGLQIEYQNEIENISQEITAILTEKERTSQEISKLEHLLTEIEHKKHELVQHKLKIQSLRKDQETRESINEQKMSLEKDLRSITSNLKNDSFAVNLYKQILEQEKIANQLQEKVIQFESNKKRLNQLEYDELEKKYIQANIKAERIREFQQSKAEYELTLSRSRDELSDLHLSIYETERELEKYRGLDENLEKILEDEKKFLQEKTQFQTRINDLKKEVDSIGNRIIDYEINLKRHQLNLRKAEIYRIVQIWIRDFLIPSLHSIEKSILISLNQEFNKLYQKWFNNLIDSEDLLGFIDEDFTPIVEQGGYELDVESLSGGEKTSVALAYRLALNKIVKQVTEKMKNNILILDEPTDGFSKDQLHKMREILLDLNCEQIIIVSHEQELENVADYIYKVTKDGNTSKVLPPP
jgi:exonuclease SbcC